MFQKNAGYLCEVAGCVSLFADRLAKIDGSDARLILLYALVAILTIVCLGLKSWAENRDTPSLEVTKR